VNAPAAPSLRLLWLTEHYYPGRGGMAQSCDRIVHGLRQAGVTVDVVHLAQRGERLTVETRRQGRDIVCPLGGDPAHALNCLWNWLASQTGRDVPTHVVAFGGVLPLLAGPTYAAWLGVPLVTLLRGNDFDAGIFLPGRREIVREALQRSARVVVVSRDKARKIAALYPQVRPVWIPNGLDLAEWEPLPSHCRQAEAWRRAAVAPGRRVLGLIGQIKPKKGGLFFLEALRDSGYADRFHLLVVGETGAEVAAWLAAHADTVAATCHPFLDRSALLAHYPACDLVVLPSLYDGLPNVLLEAAGLGVPLLASTAGGMADVLVDGEHGFLFPPGDAAGCRRAIARAAAAPDAELRRLGAACRALVATELTHTQEIERYLALLRETR
jgi:glycosyltransferase involved in cell wall biosynthesis